MIGNLHPPFKDNGRAILDFGMDVVTASLSCHEVRFEPFFLFPVVTIIVSYSPKSVSSKFKLTSPGNFAFIVSPTNGLASNEPTISSIIV